MGGGGGLKFSYDCIFKMHVCLWWGSGDKCHLLGVSIDFVRNQIGALSSVFVLRLLTSLCCPYHFFIFLVIFHGSWFY